MSVVGFDLGSQSCYVAVATGGVIETVTNEYSDRSTGSYVSFGQRLRCAGTSAKNQAITNLKNTTFGFKRLLGLSYDHPLAQTEMSNLINEFVKTDNNEIGYKVRYLDEEHIFTPLELIVAMLTKLKNVAETALQSKVTDCVISIPIYFADSQRRQVLDAARIAGLNCLRLLNDTTAAALAYGFYKSDLPNADSETAKNVAFVDMGYTGFQVSICALKKESVKILSSVADHTLGGREIDYRLLQHFIEVFKVKYRLDINEKPKAKLRLLSECEKLKKLMSANTTEIPMNIECLMNDRDVSGRMKRADMEELCQDLFDKIPVALNKALANAKITAQEIASIEIVGGSTRIPAVKQALQTFFGQEISTTLNQDEAVAKGCALQCAILSPKVRRRQFAIADKAMYDVHFIWGNSNPFQLVAGDALFPCLKSITLPKAVKGDFPLNTFYQYPEEIINNQINITRNQVHVPDAETDSPSVKIRFRLDDHRILSLEEITLEEKLPAPAAETEAEASTGKAKEETPDQSEKMECDDAKKTDDKQGKESKSKPKHVKKSTKVPFEHGLTFSMSNTALERAIEKELEIQENERKEKLRADARNSVEEYVYDMRGKIYEQLSEFISEEDREAFSRKLDDAENWLYEDGEDAEKSAYTNKLEELKKLGNPILLRYRESQTIDAAMQDLLRITMRTRKEINRFDNKEEIYSHLDPKEVDKLREEAASVQQWADKQIGALRQKKKYDNPTVLTKEVEEKAKGLSKLATSVLDKKKPSPPKDKEPEKAKGQNDTQKRTEDKSNAEEPEAMDVESPAGDNTAKTNENVDCQS
ncbi:uncharacterized protein TRIADDRAFT_25019 [Trichoplax adhaerens]|uniref:Uncharacterized protein n=1 Tax=Trichoplax adhaerens TaxID=10228 RepID=B3RXU7_TRIAD|nr:hypothetical protein TRIADDRAFT_25019 [Trichoplax adhaerens]EDV24917.1 hypothetical protein TRIADDRAFT_25019 [Trichoplax adhaerens]|eukprot:XP_002112807.1 hypothetical protein TRIADDRAFT_25019 [Trichoplax adhaerens]